MANVELMNDYSGHERSGGNTGERLAGQITLLRDAEAFREPVEVVEETPYNWSDYYNRGARSTEEQVGLPEAGNFDFQVGGEGVLRFVANRYRPQITQGAYNQAAD